MRGFSAGFVSGVVSADMRSMLRPRGSGRAEPSPTTAGTPHRRDPQPPSARATRFLALSSTPIEKERVDP